MRIRIVTQSTVASDVLVRFAAAPPTPSPADVGVTAGDLSVSRSDKSRRNRSQATVDVSLGPRNECTAEAIRRAAGCVARWLTTSGARRASVDAGSLDLMHVEGSAEAVCEGLALGSFRFDGRKTSRKPTTPQTVDVLVPHGGLTIRRRLRRTLAVAQSVNLAREWAHEPPNVINPVTLARLVQRIARSSGLKCTVYDHKQLARMKANALLSVGVASKTPARLMMLEHRPASGNTRRAKPVVLIGKAITFDTGGYSLKDRTGIVGMKYDKCGGMAVIATLKAAAECKLNVPLVGIIAAAENMISGEAYRPNDIIKTMSGKTVEIISTDAEGRMALADALTFAQKRFRPRAMIDVATLTGGVVVALGGVRAGLFSNDDKLADALLTSGDRVHERVWRLPLDDDYLDLIRGDDSDLKNFGGRQAHPVIGGMFLKQFVDDGVPWAHLDIAGTATCDKDQPYCPKGATGFGVRLLMDYLSQLR